MIGFSVWVGERMYYTSRQGDKERMGDKETKPRSFIFRFPCWRCEAFRARVYSWFEFP